MLNEPSYKVPISHFSTGPSTVFRISAPQTRANLQQRTQGGLLDPPRTHERGSAASSQSIKVFADIDVLSPSPTGGRASQNGLWNDDANDDGDRSNSNKAFGFHGTARPLQSAISAPQPVYHHEDTQAENTWQEPPSKVLSRNTMDREWISRASLMQSFPEPPRHTYFRSRRLLNLKELFPESRYLSDPSHDHPVLNVDKMLPQPPYHAFDHRTKTLLVALVSIVGVLSPLSASIYFPALSAVAKEFRIDTIVVLLTIAIPITFQGIGPLVVTPFSERLGHRPVFIIALITLLGANLGLIFIKDATKFIILRVIQSVISAPLPMIGAATIADISTGKEREEFSSLSAAVLLLSFPIGPVLGGIFTQMATFRTIFWFLSIVTAAILFLVIIFYPETNRRIAGNGTVVLKLIHRPLFSMLRRSANARFTSSDNTSSQKSLYQLFIEPFRSFTHKSILPSLFLGGVTFAILAIVISTTALILPARYHLSLILIGAVYLPSGVGCVLGFFLMKYRLQSDYLILESRYNARVTAAISTGSPVPAFPIEKARLRSAWWIMSIFVGTTVGYGFSLHAPSVLRLAILQFFIVGNGTALMLINSVLINDLHPSTSVNASINLVRFATAGLMIGIVQLFFSRIGTGFTFLALGTFMIVLSSIMVLQWRYGEKWRKNTEFSSGKIAPGT